MGIHHHWTEGSTVSPDIAYRCFRRKAQGLLQHFSLAHCVAKRFKIPATQSSLYVVRVRSAGP